MATLGFLRNFVPLGKDEKDYKLFPRRRAVDIRVLAGVFVIVVEFGPRGIGRALGRGLDRVKLVVIAANIQNPVSSDNR